MHDDIITLLVSIQDKIESGEVDAVTAYVSLKKIEKALDSVKEYAYKIASNSFAGMNKNEMENLPFGAKARETTRSTYEYSQNEKYSVAQSEAKRLEKLIKIATDNNSAIADPETGEMIYAVPFKMSTTYAVTV